MAQPVPGKDGDKYVPYEQRTGNESIVYFTRNLSAEGLIRAYEQVCARIEGNTAVKLHTGEQHGPNIIPAAWVKQLMQKDLPEATIVETNTYYEGDRYTTEQHRRTLEVNGWTFCPVDIMDEEDTLTIPVKGGKWFDRMAQEHRHRLCRRACGQGVDTHHSRPGRHVGHQGRRVHGTHDGIDQGRGGPLRRTHHLRQRDA